MARIGRRAQQRRTKHIILGTLGFLVALIIVFGVWKSLADKPEPLDARMCPDVKDGGPKGHIVLLVDKTDPLSFTQRQAFQVYLEKLVKEKTPTGYLLSLFLLGEDFKETATPILELCNPGSEKEKNKYTENVDRLRKKYEEDFVKEVLKQSDAMVTQTSAKWSPIFEMLQLVSINGFGKNGVRNNKRLIVISDMLHNTQQFTMYKGKFDYPDFASTDYAQRTQLDFDGAKVELYYLMNTPQLQTKRLEDFWEQYFAKAKAKVVAVNTL